MRLELARHPRRLQAKHPIIIAELLALAEDSKQRGVAMMIKMLRELHKQGRNSQYLVKMQTCRVVLEVIEAYQQGVPVFEEPHT